MLVVEEKGYEGLDEVSLDVLEALSPCSTLASYEQGLAQLVGKN